MATTTQTRERTVNGMKSTVNVVRSELHNGATIEICETDRGYPMLRIERAGKEAYIVPGFGEMKLEEANKVVAANFDKVVANAKNGN